MTDLVPTEDLAPSLPSRVVTVNAVDLTEGDWMQDASVTFALVGDIHVGADRRIVTARPITLPLTEGKGSIRLPAWNGSIGGEWAIAVKKSWAPHPYYIRVPVGSTSIDLSEIAPLQAAPAGAAEWLLTGAAVTVTEGDTWHATVAVTGGVARFHFTVPPGIDGVRIARVATTADNFRDLVTGDYHVASQAVSEHLGLPDGKHGVLSVDKWGGGPGGVATFVTRDDPPQEWRYAWRVDGTPLQEWQLADPDAVRAAGVHPHGIALEVPFREAVFPLDDRFPLEDRFPPGWGRPTRVAAELDEDGRLALDVIPPGLVRAPEVPALVGPLIDGALAGLPESAVATAELVESARLTVETMIGPPPALLDPDEWTAAPGELIATPTHDGSGEATHPSVMFFPGGLWGWRWWMAMTPYPDSDDAHEDPNLLVSHDGRTWQVPPGVTNPLDDAPGTSAGRRYNSDTHLAYKDGTLYVFWREHDRRLSLPAEQIILWCRSSTDGVTFGPKFEVWRQDRTETQKALSPAWVHDGHQWRMYYLPDRGSVACRTAPELTGPWSEPVEITLPTRPGPGWWHLDVQYVDGWYLGLLNDSSGAHGELYLITSADGHTWDVATDPLLPSAHPDGDYTKFYRSCLVPYVEAGQWRIRAVLAGFLPTKHLYITDLEEK